jgi:NAD(P)-dependent dehydrogenase (short-subunit alcohol dehydrogenase family)
VNAGDGRDVVSLSGRAVAVVAPAVPFADALCDALGACGAHVQRRPVPVGGVDTGAETFDGVVFMPTPAGVGRHLVDLGDEEWSRSCERPMADGLATAQWAFRAMPPADGRIVFILPSAVLTGAAGAVAFATACEGLRLMAKSAARGWGRRSIVVNTITVPLDAFGVAVDPQDVVPSRWPAALDQPDPSADVAPIVALCLSGAAGGLTGATLGVDGGLAMSP